LPLAAGDQEVNFLRFAQRILLSLVFILQQEKTTLLAEECSRQ
jgi:hypothetical protein